MERLIIKGGNRLSGEITLQGAKNSALPILAAALLGKKTVLHNCPNLSDVSAACDILETLGCTVMRQGTTLFIDAGNAKYNDPPEHLMREMRSSILFLGAMLAGFGKARVSFPGGCELGARPVDMHIEGLRKLGALIEEDHGFLSCRVEKPLCGCEITLPFPSVGATENIMIAATAAKGCTVIRNAAREPEIADLAEFLNGCGAYICLNSDKIIIEGARPLHSCEHTVIPDRIEAATFLCAAATTGGDITLKSARKNDVVSMIPVLEEMGCIINCGESELSLKAPKRLLPAKMIKTMPYPGFPTDAQAVFMAALCTAQGSSMMVENIFEARYKHVGELMRMGAKIHISDRVAVIDGIDRLHSASVQCTDLRGGAALVVAALAAEGESVITSLRHIDRGYDLFEQKLRLLGADIKREGAKTDVKKI